MNLTLTHWDPFRTTNPHPPVSGAEMPNFFRGLLRGWDENDSLVSSSWMPPVDISEDPNKIALTAELPGFKEGDVNVELHADVLTLSGERKRESEMKDRNFTRVERSYGQFSRSFTLPSTVDRENVKASFADGLLTIELPKKPEAKPRQIPVGAGAKEQPVS